MDPKDSGTGYRNRNREKIVYFEICRILAIFCIMFQHTGGRGVDAWKYTESIWVYRMSLIGRIISSIGVPLFWMVSGALLLPKKESWKRVYTTKLFRIAMVLFLFSAIRYFYQCMADRTNIYAEEFFRRFYTQEIFIPYWFLYEYLGILLILPLLRRMVQNLTEQESWLLFALLLGWPVLDDISKGCLGVGFMLDLGFRNSVTYFLFGYLMENCRMLRQSNKRGLCLSAGLAALVTGGVYLLLRGQQEEVPGSLIMLLALSAYYIIHYIGEKGIRDHTALCRFVLWCGGNAFCIYLIEDYLRNGTAWIWEWLSPRITAIPACGIWLLAVFLLGNILAAGMRRLPFLRKIL